MTLSTYGPNGLAATYFTGTGVLSRYETYYGFDPAGNVAVAVKVAGSTQVTTYLSDAFGKGGATAGPGFAGQWGGYTDYETGLVLLGHRYYDPNTGRFLTRDPIGYAGGINLYAYCQNNPVNFMDPLGLCPDQSGDGLSGDPMKPHERQWVEDNRALVRNWRSEPLSLVDPSIPVGLFLCVMPHGPMDYKNQPWPLNQETPPNNPHSQDVGNYNYGAVLEEAGCPEYIACVGAGYAQVVSDELTVLGDLYQRNWNSRTEAALWNGLKFGIDPIGGLLLGDHGDRPGDQPPIHRAYRDYSR